MGPFNNPEIDEEFIKKCLFLKHILSMVEVPPCFQGIAQGLMSDIPYKTDTKDKTTNGKTIPNRSISISEKGENAS